MVSLITNPIWVVKTRLALQHGGGGGAKISSMSGNVVAPYAGFFDAMGRIARTEGVTGLYKGFAPSLFLVSHGAVQFTAYERLKRAAADARRGGGVDRVGSGHSDEAEPTAFECAWLGVASKLIASAATYPSQVVRSRMQQRGNADVGVGGSEEVRRRYLGFFSSLRCVVRREGFSGLYKGMVPNVLRTLPSSGVTFMVYESTRSFLSRGREDE